MPQAEEAFRIVSEAYTVLRGTDQLSYLKTVIAQRNGDEEKVQVTFPHTPTDASPTEPETSPTSFREVKLVANM